MPKTILITGATGNVATQTIQHLKASGAKLRALVHTPAKAAALAAQGIEVVEGNLGSPRTLGPAFEGVDSAFIVVPGGAAAPQHASSALWAARQAGVKHVVRLSAVGAAHDAPVGNSRLHALSDSELAQSNLAWTVLKPHFFMQNLFMNKQSIAADGVIYSALGAGKLGMIDIADIGAAAAHVLTTPGHEGKTYTLTGPRSISMHEVAAAFTEALGKPVKYVPVPIEAADQGMAKNGVDDFVRSYLCDYFAAYASGWGDFTTDVIPGFLGRPARSIVEFARAVAPAFGRH